VVSAAADGPGATAFRAVARADAGLFTHRLDYPVAARLAAAAYRARVRPSALTLGNLLLGVGASVAVIAAAPWLDRTVVHVSVGVAVWLVWQLAYCLDCADGQLARVAGTSSSAGGRLDVLCDIAVQVALVAAVIAVSSAAGPSYPAWLPGVFAASWMVNMVTSVMAREGTNVSLVTSRSLLVQIVKLVRDYGFIVTAISATILVAPAAMVWVMAGFTLVNGGFLLASIALTARVAWRSGASGR
jgi:phosphatidylglycerophosphate synthase